MTRPSQMVRDTIVAANQDFGLPMGRLVVDEVPEPLKIDPYACIKETSPNVLDTESSGGQRIESQVIEIEIYSKSRDVVASLVDKWKTLIDSGNLVFSSPQLLRMQFLNDWITKDVIDRTLSKGVIEYRVFTQRSA